MAATTQLSWAQRASSFLTTKKEDPKLPEKQEPVVPT